MSEFSGLTICGEFYSKEWILERSGQLDSLQLDEVKKRTLEFCGEWLSGKMSFEIQTSGTTGQAKTIVITREQMSLSARLTGQFLHLREEDRALVCLSPAYIAGIMMLVRGIELNLQLTVVAPSSNPFEEVKSLETSAPFPNRTESGKRVKPPRSQTAVRERAPGIRLATPFDFTAMVPLQLQAILNSDGQGAEALNQMKAILIGGAPVSLKLEKDLQRITAPIYQTFGMTETVSHIALRRLNGPAASEFYKILPSVEIGQDARGCLTVKSPLTKDKLIVTNDLVEIKPDQSFRWLGRIDHVINSGGVKIQAEKVERAIAETLNEIENGNYCETIFFVGGVSDDKFGEIVTALFEGGELPQEVQNKLLQKLAEKLAQYEIPKKLGFVDGFIRTETGKIDRKATTAKLENFTGTFVP